MRPANTFSNIQLSNSRSYNVKMLRKDAHAFAVE